MLVIFALKFLPACVEKSTYMLLKTENANGIFTQEMKERTLKI